MVVSADKRKPWEELFFDGEPGRPLSREKAGSFGLPLEMVRLAPSASNKQPWRVVLDGTKVHFCLLRNKGYGDGLPIDVQKNDIGIAMCHFEMTAGAGKWTFDEGICYNNEWEYVKTWETIRPQTA